MLTPHQSQQSSMSVVQTGKNRAAWVTAYQQQRLTWQQYEQKWAPLCSSIRQQDSRVVLTVEADLDTVLAMVETFPGLLECWQLQADQTLSHRLEFSLLNEGGYLDK